MKNPNISVAPQQGQPLPNDWQRQAATRKQAGEASYLERLQNAWRGDLRSPNHSAAMEARLRSDSRMDGLRLVEDTEEEEVWASAGVTVRRRK